MSRTARRDSQPEATASQPVIVVDGFLPGRLAMAMRRDIDAHFASPQAHRRETHQVWNYWFVPELYTYLRTDADRVIGREHVDAFHEALREWSTGHLGMAQVTWPYLSLYVPGCRQDWHNDARNGRFAYVYSLTRNERRTSGGETLVLREGDPFRGNLVSATSGRGFYEAIEPRFNRLVIFDDRLPHAVERVDGLMDPVEGRIVLHGHLSEGSAIIAGALPAAAATNQLNDTLGKFGAELGGHDRALRRPNRVSPDDQRRGVGRDLRGHRRPGHSSGSWPCRLGSGSRQPCWKVESAQIPRREGPYGADPAGAVRRSASVGVERYDMGGNGFTRNRVR